jgi:hypothetical protein
MDLAFPIAGSVSTPDRLQPPVDRRAVRDGLHHLRDLRAAIVCSFRGKSGAHGIDRTMKINISARSAWLSAGIDNGADNAVNYLLAIA